MRIPPTPAPEPGEWQTETNIYGGTRRYRMVGNIKEYEMDVTVDGHTIPQSQLEDYHRRKKAAEQARIEAERKKAAEAKPPRNCPFSDGMNTNCTQEKCALYNGDGCTLARWNAEKATEGLQCPFSKYHAKCRKDCALYKGGCTFTGIKDVVIDFSDIKESEDK